VAVLTLALGIGANTAIGVIADVRAFDLQEMFPTGLTAQCMCPASEHRCWQNREVPVSEVKTMGAVVSEAVSTPASTTSLFVIFAGLARWQWWSSMAFSPFWCRNVRTKSVSALRSALSDMMFCG
jgi:hypothetical protein